MICNDGSDSEAAYGVDKTILSKGRGDSLQMHLIDGKFASLPMGGD